MAWQWTEQREKVAQLVAKDELTEDQIGHIAGISTITVTRWKRALEFKARVAQIVETVQAAALENAIADKNKRLARLNDRWMQVERLRQARARDMQDVPGGDTGLLVRTVKSIRVPKTSKPDAAASSPVLQTSKTDAVESSGVPSDVENDGGYVANTTVRVIEEYAADTAIMREERELAEQAAREMGERRTKVDHTLSGPKGGPLEIAIAEAARRVTPAELEAEVARILAEDKDDGGITEASGADTPDAEPSSSE